MLKVREPSYSSHFRRDVKRMEKRGHDMTKLRQVLQLLIEVAPLPARLRDHSLKSNWAGYRDLHIEPDWLLIYKLDGENVHFERTGTHSDLFR
ncbi:type II toxin-antitoxin system YafQ family toxin [Brucella sp. IR073]|uniref:type II toxin-antitoxin system YafQ family toxin n=1 Tax=unclassified Brucella TaxID=2632610 RepID=UPI003B9814CC